MNQLNKMGGDERFDHRLLSSLNQNIPLNIQQLKHIKKNVYLAKINNEFQFIVKGFSTRRNLLIQDGFTSTLKINDFHNTYSFYHGLPTLYFESRHYGYIEYIKNDSIPFFYDSINNCQDGLTLLQKFHHTTKKMVGSYKRLLPMYDLQNKWRERFLLFVKNKDILSFYIPKEIYKELLSWGEWSLSQLEKNRVDLSKQPNVILHGDVAHHNFIRSAKGELNIIDFDLISIGPVITDYLQYANRILPYIDWSLHDLAALEPLQSYCQQKIFLYALVFPTDIFREWNRFIKESAFHNPNHIRSVFNITICQFEKRRAFVQDIISSVNS